MILWFVCSLSLIAGEGVVVERLGEESHFHEAGIKVGDIILGWRSLPPFEEDGRVREERFENVFDWYWFLDEQESNENIIFIIGNSEETERLIGKGEWDVDVHPNFSKARMAAYRKGLNAEGAYNQSLVWLKCLSLPGSYVNDKWLLLRMAMAFEKEGNMESFGFCVEAAMEEVPVTLKSEVLCHVMMARAYANQLNLEKIVWSMEEASRLRLLVGQSFWGLEKDQLNLITYKWQFQGVSGSLKTLAGVEERARSCLYESIFHANVLEIVAAYYWNQDQLPEASTLLSRSLQAYLSSGADALSLANIYSNLGTLYWKLGKLQDGKLFLEQALGYMRHLDIPVDHVLNNLGLILQDFGNWLEASKYFKMAVQEGQRRKVGALQIANYLNNLGALQIDLNDLEGARRNLSTALEIRRTFMGGSSELASTLVNFGFLSVEKGLLNEAEALFFEAYDELERGGLQVSLAMATVCSALGHIFRIFGKNNKAVTFQRRSLDIRSAIAPGNISLAGSFNSLSVTYADTGQFDAAEAYILRAIEMEEVYTGSGNRLPRYYANYGSFLKNQGRYEEATFWLQKASEIELSQPSESYFLADIYMQLAFTFLFLGQDEATQRILDELYRSPMLLSERHVLKAQLPLLTARLYLADRQSKVAFHCFEESIRSINAYLATREVTSLKRVSLRAEFEYIKQDALETALKIGSSEAMALVESLRSNELNRVLKEQLLSASGESMLDQSSGIYSDEYTFVHYYPLEGEILIFVDGLLHSRTKVPRHFLDAVVSDFANALHTPPRLTPHDSDLFLLKKNNDILHRLLIKPILAVIERSKRLVFLPFGSLAKIPMGAIKGHHSELKGETYLIEELPVVVASTIESFHLSRAKRQQEPAYQFVGFARPWQACGHPKKKGSSCRFRGLDELAFSEDEVRSIAKAFPGPNKLFTGRGAREVEVRKLIGDHVSVLHFACHAFYDEENPAESSLFLAHSDPSDEADDGFLKISELINSMKVSADLVVLSACSTAAGDAVPGEGVLNFPYAFQVAGARSVIAPLWGINDATTSSFMTLFYQSLSRGMDIAESLRQAQMSFIKEPVKIRTVDGLLEVDASDPYYWAAFQLIGPWD